MKHGKNKIYDFDSITKNLLEDLEKYIECYDEAFIDDIFIKQQNYEFVFHYNNELSRIEIKFYKNI